MPRGKQLWTAAIHNYNNKQINNMPDTNSYGDTVGALDSLKDKVTRTPAEPAHAAPEEPKQSPRVAQIETAAKKTFDQLNEVHSQIKEGDSKDDHDALAERAAFLRSKLHYYQDAATDIGGKPQAWSWLEGTPFSNDPSKVKPLDNPPALQRMGKALGGLTNSLVPSARGGRSYVPSVRDPTDINEMQ